MLNWARRTGLGVSVMKSKRHAGPHLAGPDGLDRRHVSPGAPALLSLRGGHHITAAAGDMCVAQAVESGAAGGLRETQTRPIFAMHVSVYCFLRNPFAKVCLLRVS